MHGLSVDRAVRRADPRRAKSILKYCKTFHIIAAVANVDGVCDGVASPTGGRAVLLALAHKPRWVAIATLDSRWIVADSITTAGADP
jgi:hypothetical protein